MFLRPARTPQELVLATVHAHAVGVRQPVPSTKAATPHGRNCPSSNHCLCCCCRCCLFAAPVTAAAVAADAVWQQRGLQAVEPHHGRLPGQHRDGVRPVCRVRAGQQARTRWHKGEARRLLLAWRHQAGQGCTDFYMCAASCDIQRGSRGRAVGTNSAVGRASWRNGGGLMHLLPGTCLACCHSLPVPDCSPGPCCARRRAASSWWTWVPVVWCTQSRRTAGRCGRWRCCLTRAALSLAQQVRAQVAFRGAWPARAAVPGVCLIKYQPASAVAPEHQSTCVWFCQYPNVCHAS